MNYGDFSSLVQLGVGLHLGTALLQEVGDLGVRPLRRSLKRLNEMAAEPPAGAEDILDRIQELNTKVAVFEIRSFKLFRQMACVNAVAGVALLILLTAMAFAAQVELPLELAVSIAALATLPVVGTLFSYWIDTRDEYRPLIREAHRIEVDFVEASRAPKKMVAG